MEANFCFSSVSRFNNLSLIQGLETTPYGLSGQSLSTNNSEKWSEWTSGELSESEDYPDYSMNIYEYKTI